MDEFIRTCDTVLWLVSPDSVKSDWCNWEIGRVNQLRKRLIPIRVREVDYRDLPKSIGSIHMLPAQDVFALDEHLAALIEVLNSDRVWLKDATRLADRARQWQIKERERSLLLRGLALQEAELWERRRPPSAPPPTSEVLELILASRQASTRRQRYWAGGAFAIAAGALGLAVFAYSQQSTRLRVSGGGVERRPRSSRATTIASMALGSALTAAGS